MWGSVLGICTHTCNDYLGLKIRRFNPIHRLLQLGIRSLVGQIASMDKNISLWQLESTIRTSIVCIGNADEARSAHSQLLLSHPEISLGGAYFIQALGRWQMSADSRSRGCVRVVSKIELLVEGRPLNGSDDVIHLQG